MSRNLSHLSSRHGPGPLHEAVHALDPGDPVSLTAASARFHVGEASLLAAASFYDFLRPEQRAKQVFVCDGSSCELAGTQTALRERLRNHFPDSAIGTMRCLGQCHTNSAFLYQERSHSAASDVELDRALASGERAQATTFAVGSNLAAQDPDALARITGVPRALVREAALAYARAPRAMAFHGLGITEHSQGSKGVMLLANLAMMTGHLGRPGTGINPLRGQNNVQGAADMGVQPRLGPGYLDLADAAVRDHYARVYGASVPAAHGRTIPEMLEGARDGHIRALWIVGEDIAQTDPDTSEVLKALSRLDFLVVQELFMTKTAQRAHVVLPAASFLEKSGTFTNGERRIQRVNRAVAPVYGARPDGEIIVEMMNRMGYAQAAYDPAQLWGEISRAAPILAGVTWEGLGGNGKQWPLDASGAGTTILHQASFTRGKGKFHFFPFERSRELTQHAAEYPYILTTGRRLVHYNCGAMTRRTPDKELATADRLYVNPADAHRKHVHEGETARVFSPRAEVHLPVKISNEVPEGVLFTTFHFPEELVNLLTSDEMDPESLCPEYKVVAVDFTALHAAAQ